MIQHPDQGKDRLFIVVRKQSASSPGNSDYDIEHDHKTESLLLEDSAPSIVDDGSNNLHLAVPSRSNLPPPRAIETTQTIVIGNILIACLFTITSVFLLYYFYKENCTQNFSSWFQLAPYIVLTFGAVTLLPTLCLVCRKRNIDQYENLSCLEWTFCGDIIYLDCLYFGHYIALNIVAVALILFALVFCFFTPMHMIAIYVAIIYGVFAMFSMRWQNDSIREKATITQVIYDLFAFICAYFLNAQFRQKSTQFFEQHRRGCDCCSCISVLGAISLLVLLETQQILMS